MKRRFGGAGSGERGAFRAHARQRRWRTGAEAAATEGGAADRHDEAEDFGLDHQTGCAAVASTVASTAAVATKLTVQIIEMVALAV